VKRKENTPHSLQPYLQLAHILKDKGYDDEARQIRLYGREQSRAALSYGLLWLWETGKYYLIGYGHDFRGALIAMLILLAIGTVVVRSSSTGRDKQLGVVYSFDMLLPILKLKKAHADIELEPPFRRYFYVQQILGYILASFHITGLAELAKPG
jgi:hypothetical protein